MGDSVIAEQAAGEHTIYGVTVQVSEVVRPDEIGSSYMVTAKGAGGDVDLTEDGMYHQYPTDEWLHDLVAEWLGKQYPRINAMVQAALMRAQHLKEEQDKILGHLQHIGKSPARSKRATRAAAMYEGALTILASVLAAAGVGDVIRLDLPSLEEAERYLGQWDAERTRQAFERVVTG